MLTARTLYTYKYEVAINNDKVHRPALSFLSRDLLECHLRQVNKEAHLSGRPGDTSPPPYTGAPRGHAVTENAVLAAGSVGRLPFSVRSPWKVGIGVLGIPSPGFWSGRIIVVHLILTFRVQICKTLISP